MPREIYNEGRVVGYSAYELYVRQTLSENPNADIATEKEWLSQSLSYGSSMLLHITPEDMQYEDPDLGPSIKYFVDYPLPENSKLLATNTIFGSLFFGEGSYSFDDEYNYHFDTWSKYVSDYGRGIMNMYPISANGRMYPETSDDATTYPHSWSHEFYSRQISQMYQYSKISDGVVLQPGTWSQRMAVDGEGPYADFYPNFKGRAVVRLQFAEEVTTDFWVLLSGFMLNSVAIGSCGADGSTDTEHPENGDFLGPAVYPWANKILFSYPSAMGYYMRKGFKTDELNSGLLSISTDSNNGDVWFETSSIVSSGNAISVDGPDTPAGEIALNSNISSSNLYLQVNSDGEGNVILTPVTIVAGAGITVSGPTDGKITISADVSQQIQTLRSEISQIRTDAQTAIQKIVDKIYKGGTVSLSTSGRPSVTFNGSWEEADGKECRIPIGTLNVNSSTVSGSHARGIYSHWPNEDGDLKVK